MQVCSFSIENFRPTTGPAPGIGLGTLLRQLHAAYVAPARQVSNKVHANGLDLIRKWGRLIRRHMRIS